MSCWLELVNPQKIEVAVQQKPPGDVMLQLCDYIAEYSVKQIEPRGLKSAIWASYVFLIGMQVGMKVIGIQNSFLCRQAVIIIPQQHMCSHVSADIEAEQVL